MYNLTDEQKAIFKDGKSHTYELKVYVGTERYFTRENGTVFSSDKIVTESLTYSQRITDGSKKLFGNVCTSTLRFETYTETNLNEKYIIVDLIYGGVTIPYGRFFVSEIKKNYDRDVFTVTAYDYTWFLKVDVSDRFTYKYVTSLSTAISIIMEMCSLNYGGLVNGNSTLDLDSLMEYKPSNSICVTGAEIMGHIAEVNARNVMANRNGEIVLIAYAKQTTYELVFKDNIMQGSVSVGDYKQILGVMVTTLASDGQGEKTEITVRNPASSTLANKYWYELDGANGVMYNHPKTTTAGEPFDNGIERTLSVFKSLVPAEPMYNVSFSMEGRPYLDLGDRLMVVDITPVPIYVQSIELKGIGALKQTITNNYDLSDILTEGERQKLLNDRTQRG